MNAEEEAEILKNRMCVSNKRSYCIATSHILSFLYTKAHPEMQKKMCSRLCRKIYIAIDICAKSGFLERKKKKKERERNKYGDKLFSVLYSCSK